MEVRKPSLAQIRKKGLEALARELGPVGMVRFLQQFEEQSGDYTQQREQWLGNVTLEEVVAEIKQNRNVENL